MWVLHWKISTMQSICRFEIFVVTSSSFQINLESEIFWIKIFWHALREFFKSIESGQKNNLEMSSLQILHIKITQKLSKNIFWINTICLQILCSLHVQFSHVVCLNLHQFFSLLMWIKITRYNQYLITFAKQSFKMLYRQFF